MKANIYVTIGCFFLALLCNRLHAQKRSNKQNLVYVDKQGVLRWTKDKTEASFFGVNYTTPFAYAYRAHKVLNADLEKAIQQDVYHFARLGLDAFRVHVWDTEISDTAGNLLENENLRLFDFLLAELKKRNIKTIVTPIAFWGNGYPERDEATPGFARKYGKGRSTTEEAAILAQENYLKQFFKHINPYTKLSCIDDPDIIAVEINNEPSHSGPKAGVTTYINRLTAAIKSTGWTKPVYYNIAQNPFYADAVAKASVDGVSFQWYPSGLVANREVKGNFLPHVDHYTIPFDTIPEYRNKSKMVYEFDAADLLQSCMYPAMARSFKEAGMQWVTQFAYDPLAIAYANTEYQTHYLNLAYTPSKAISILIASKVFHKLPRLKSYGNYPADSVFDVFRVSYKNSLSEMNSEEEFYYSNATDTKPKDILKLRHIAGVGNSPIVKYEGTGAYFLDKLQDGVWKLEIMPDIIQIRDPFERASPKKEVTRIQWKHNKMNISADIMGINFYIESLSGGSSYDMNGANAEIKNEFYISPGSYLLKTHRLDFNYKGEKGFFAPRPFATELFLSHTPAIEVSSGKPFIIPAKVAGLDTADKISLEIRFAPRWRTIPMTRKNAGDYYAEVPAEAAIPGVLNYRIIVQKGNDYTVFPGNNKGNPNAWDNTNTDTWQTIVAGEKSGLEVFNTNTDRTSLVQYNPDWRNNTFRFVPSDKASQLAVQLSAKNLSDKQVMGWQFYFGDKVKGRQTELASFNTIVIKARAESPANAKVAMITNDALCFSASINAGSEWKEIRIPLNTFRADSMLLLPRPYPGFLPLWFMPGTTGSFNLQDAEKLQVLCYGEGKAAYLEIASVWLEK